MRSSNYMKFGLPFMAMFALIAIFGSHLTSEGGNYIKGES